MAETTQAAGRAAHAGPDAAAEELPPDAAADSRVIAPLRAVVQTKATGRGGSDISPHAFWMTNEYALSLECGHVQLRTSCQFRAQGFPTKVRCADCAPIPVRSRARKFKQNPAFDPMAVMLHQSLAAATGDSDGWLDSINAGHRFIEDSVDRARVYGAVARVLMDRFSSCNAPVAHMQAPGRTAAIGTDPRWTALVDAVMAWSIDPSEDARKNVSVVRRRLYHAQRAQQCWTCTRGLISASSVASDRALASVRAVRDAFTWIHATRDGVYAQLRAVRNSIDSVATIPDSPSDPHPLERLGAVLDRVGGGNPEIRAAMDKRVREDEATAKGMVASLAGQLWGDIEDTLASATVIAPEHADLLAAMIREYDAEREATR